MRPRRAHTELGLQGFPCRATLVYDNAYHKQNPTAVAENRPPLTVVCQVAQLGCEGLQTITL